MSSSFPYRIVSLAWEVGFHHDPGDTPERWVPAQVPGAVQLDWARAEGWGPHWQGDNWRQYRWMEDVYWTYRAALPPVAPGAGERLFFVCGGVDYRFAVSWNGRTLHEQEGMFTPVEIDITEEAGVGGDLRVTVAPAPKSAAQPVDRSQANRSCKPAVSYGWDFHPRLVPSGIWQDTHIEVRPRSHLRAVDIGYALTDDLGRADLRAEISLSEPAPEGATLRWTLWGPGGNVVHEQTAGEAAGRSQVTLRALLEAPALWWPHDQGTPALYTSTIELRDDAGDVLSEARRRVGFRRVRLIMHEGAWRWPDGFPKTRSNPPITLEVNGRRLFVKGANWVSPDIFPGTLTPERYREQLDLVHGANLALLRMWGGAPAQKEPFYDLCDELGILVWQEFPLACNRYPDDPDYLAVLDQESRSLLHRLRGHACLALWCGGNELFNAWSGMTDQSLPLRLLNRNCYDLDPGTPFLPTSPVMGMGHGHYVFRDRATGEEAWQIFQRAACTAYTEFGCAGPAPVSVLQSFLPENERFPPRPGTVWETHHAFGAWMPNSHLYLDVIEHYFGPSATLEALVERGQLLQAEGYKGLFEEARRQKPAAAMALNWCWNEPWPCAANNSLVAWPCAPKPALAAVRAACRPTLASARLRKFQWSEGEWFDPELWLLSDAPQATPGGRIEAWLRADQRETLLLTWEYPGLPPGENRRGPRMPFPLPAIAGDRFELLLRCPENPALDSIYTLAFRRPDVPASPGGEIATPAMNL